MVFGHRKRLHRKGGHDSQPQGQTYQVNGGIAPPPQSFYARPAAAVTNYSIHSALPYVHQTASTIQLSSEYPRPQPQRSSNPSKSQLSLAKWQSYTDLSGRLVSETVNMANSTKTELEMQMRECLSTSVDMSGAILRKLDSLITSMDEGLFTPKDDMVAAYPVQHGDRSHGPAPANPPSRTNALSFFSKVYLYHNSRLPPHLPPLHLNRQTYALLHLAAQYSHDVYKRPSNIDQSYVSADARHGTKAMLIKSMAIDDMDTIVLAIRGTQSFRDWAVNMKTEPRSPRGFLDDPLNLCHAGFLSVAQKMLAPVAARLCDLLSEKPNRASYSLLITGHSAGGAVASLLYCHMRSGMPSGLSTLHSFFKNVHCVTFGVPPISLRPLYPSGASDSIFFSFVNQGDPVARADKSYVTSLLNLYLSPAPFAMAGHRYARLNKRVKPITWRVPPASLSLAGQVIVLRRTHAAPAGGHGPLHGSRERVEACLATDTLMRQVVFGDPLMHMMGLYATRIYDLAGSGRR